jgi:phosphoribosyl 1,2-cyclic phosphodiesterase
MYDTNPSENGYTREQIERSRALSGSDSATSLHSPQALSDFSEGRTGFHLHVIASGSKGNASIVETPTTCLLIDCGITKKAFMSGCEEVGFDPARIEAVLVTHEHTDHTKGLGVTLRGLRKLGRIPQICATQGTIDHSLELQAIASDFPISPIVHDQSMSIGAINIQFVPTSHDAADPVCMAFETECAAGRDVLGYVTDTGVFPDGLPSLLGDARVMALESNHDERMLREGPYPYALKQRVASDEGHLSNDQSDEALASLLNNKLQTVIGMHLSETNNVPRLARAGFQQVVDNWGHTATVYIGRQRMPLSIG